MVDLFSWRVLSSLALRIVAPRMAALEAAMMVKSLPVMPRRTSLGNVNELFGRALEVNLVWETYMLAVLDGVSLGEGKFQYSRNQMKCKRETWLGEYSRCHSPEAA